MKIILIGGKANSGKDSSNDYITEYYREKGLDVVNLQISYYIKMYAKQIDKYFFIKRILQDIDIYSRYFDIVTISDGRSPEEFEEIS